ncbi:MAG: GNAT family N-acetyltransferase [Pseudomonadota bacterium]
MGQVTVRDVKPEDRAKWDQLWEGYLVFYEQELTKDVTDATWDRLLSDDPSTVCLIAADENDQPVGFAHLVLHPSTWAIEPYCYLEDLFVDPDVRASGIGRALINEIYRRADANGWPYVYWKTQETNYRARFLYDQMAERETYMVYGRN